LRFDRTSVRIDPRRAAVQYTSGTLNPMLVSVKAPCVIGVTSSGHEPIGAALQHIGPATDAGRSPGFPAHCRSACAPGCSARFPRDWTARESRSTGRDDARRGSVSLSEHVTATSGMKKFRPAETPGRCLGWTGRRKAVGGRSGGCQSAGDHGLEPPVRRPAGAIATGTPSINCHRPGSGRPRQGNSSSVI